MQEMLPEIIGHRSMGQTPFALLIMVGLVVVAPIVAGLLVTLGDMRTTLKAYGLWVGILAISILLNDGGLEKGTIHAFFFLLLYSIPGVAAMALFIKFGRFLKRFIILPFLALVSGFRQKFSDHPPPEIEE